MIGFINTLVTSRTFKQYNYNADLHNSEFTVTQALGSQSTLVVSW
jgi:hypothetical protein